jgi:hypothetical protein
MRMSIALPLLIAIPIGASPRMLTPERPLSAPVSRHGGRLQIALLPMGHQQSERRGAAGRRGGDPLPARYHEILEMRTIDPVSGAGPAVLIDSAYPSYPDTPRIFRSGSTLMAVWLHDRTVLAQRIDAQGVPGPFPVVLGRITGATCTASS